jgi:hypothetical protein
MTLTEATDKVLAAWAFPSEAYAATMTREDFVRHIVLHCAKDAGKLASGVEPVDHWLGPGHHSLDHWLGPGQCMLKRSTRNMLVNALRLCSALGFDPDALIHDYLQETTHGTRTDDE